MVTMDILVLKTYDVPIEPPADIEQYSNRPSKTGQSSPTLSDEGVEYSDAEEREATIRTFVLFFDKTIHIAGCYSIQEVNIFI